MAIVIEQLILPPYDDPYDTLNQFALRFPTVACRNENLSTLDARG